MYILEKILRKLHQMSESPQGLSVLLATAVLVLAFSVFVFAIQSSF